ncbi:helix-turn-helix transcriptional regulator [Knoellia subterranea]|uniref:LuxR family transcriptional regulator n=1 Tax=Knoellia subterranea KCTC 19937 TaxID=1385521 RepID=A0A0A0JQC3_9MICO|nr:helix-turn-helix transcriptional regulator [Knoellia subterranea]KGN37796.1 LuxR family transcriptional regulator [Knoellia subterranea KCTC 19937]
MTPPVRELVGRDADLARITEILGLDDPRGVGVVVSGDAGIGKSSLLATVSADAEAAGWTVAWGHCVGQSGSGVAHLPFTELVARLQQLVPDVVEDAVAARPGLAALLPGARDESVAPSSPSQVAEGVHALLTAVGEVAPLLVVIEDAHWADHSSRDLLTLLLTRGFSSPVALVVTYRSDDLHRQHPLHETLAVWARIAGVERLDLQPLADSAIRDIVTSAKSPDLDERTTVEITRRAEGNPFFAEELAASTVSGQPITGNLGRVLWARVDQLSDPAQHVVRTMALGGRTISHDLLLQLVDLTEPELEEAIAEGVERHVIETSWPPAYTFRHALIGETTTNDLLPGPRMRLHRAYAAALASDPTLGPASELARHAAASGDLETAVAASRRAARKDLAAGGPADALAHLEQAMGWLPESAPERDEVSLEASDAALSAGDVVRSVQLLQDRIEHPGDDQSPVMRARLLATCANRARLIDLAVGERGPALTAEAMALVPAEDTPERLFVLTAHMQQLVDTRQYTEAAQLGDEATALAQRLNLPGALTEVRTVMSRVIEVHDDLDALEAHIDRLLADLGDRPDPLRIRIHHQAATMHHRRGNLVRALEHYDKGAALARELHLEFSPFALESLLIGGLTAYELGDWDGARRRLHVTDPALPQPGRSFFDAALMLVRAGRGEDIADQEIAAVRSWWHVDGFGVVQLVMPAVEHYGRQGDLTRALDIARDAIDFLERTWGRFHAIVRLAALVAGQAASAAPTLSDALHRRAVADLEAMMEGVDQIVAMPQRGVREPTTEALDETNTETWAWNLRLRAELLRLQWRLGTGTPPDPAEMVAAWVASVEAFERYGHAYETARSRARLAAVLAATGDAAGARRESEAARVVAARLGAGPLLAELDELHGAGAGRKAFGSDTAGSAETLTAREQEVLELVARGLSNGQVGQQLFISTKTASVHVSRILAKLGASSRTEAAAIARERGLIP